MLVIFSHERGIESKVGVLKDIEGKLRLPEKRLENNKNSYEIAKDILDYYVSLDRLDAFNINLCASLDGPNKYPGDYMQNVSLIFKLDISSNIDVNSSIVWLNPTEAAKEISDGHFAKDHGQAIQMAISYG